MIQFFMPMKPPRVTHQMKRVTWSDGKPRFYEDEKLKEARSKLMAHLGQHKPIEPYRCGVRLVVKWIFEKGKSHRDGEYKITRPDTDNLQKLLKDCMTKCGFWEDDALVASEIVEKFWGTIPGIFIRVEVL